MRAEDAQALLRQIPLDARFTYDWERNILYLNFEDLQIKSMNVIEDVIAKTRQICEPLGHKVYAVVNYGGLNSTATWMTPTSMGRRKWATPNFHGVTRFTTSAFMRAKLGDVLPSRGVAPHVYQSEEEAAGAERATVPRQD